MSVRIGYARVSTRDQNLDSQHDMLQQAGCEKTFGDTVSGVSEYREGWDNLMAYVRPGDHYQPKVDVEGPSGEPQHNRSNRDP